MGILYDAHKAQIDTILKAWETSPMPAIVQAPGANIPQGISPAIYKKHLQNQLKNETDPQEFMKTLQTVKGCLNKPTEVVDSTTGRTTSKKEEDEINAIMTVVSRDANKTEQERHAAYLNASTPNTMGVQGQTQPNYKLPDSGHVMYKGVRLTLDKPKGQFGAGGSLTISVLQHSNLRGLFEKNISWEQKNNALVKGAVAAFGAGGEVTILNFDAKRFEVGRGQAESWSGGSKWLPHLRAEERGGVEYYKQNCDLIMKLSAEGLNVKTSDGKDARSLLKPEDQAKAEKACKDKIAEVAARNAPNTNPAPSVQVQSPNPAQNQNQNQNVNITPTPRTL